MSVKQTSIVDPTRPFRLPADADPVLIPCWPSAGDRCSSYLFWVFWPDGELQRQCLRVIRPGDHYLGIRGRPLRDETTGQIYADQIAHCFCVVCAVRKFGCTQMSTSAAALAVAPEPSSPGTAANTAPPTTREQIHARAARSDY